MMYKTSWIMNMHILVFPYMYLNWCLMIFNRISLKNMIYFSDASPFSISHPLMYPIWTPNWWPILPQSFWIWSRTSTWRPTQSFFTFSVTMEASCIQRSQKSWYHLAISTRTYRWRGLSLTVPQESGGYWELLGHLLLHLEREDLHAT